MQRLLMFSDFLNEENVPLSDELEEFTVENKGEGKFSFELNSSPIAFTVLPLPSDPEGYEGLFFRLSTALENDRPSELYIALENAQKLPYKFGGIIPSSLSLRNVPGLEISLNEKQLLLMQNSPAKFLRVYFSSLSKELKSATLSYLRKRAQMYGVVLECMFFYIRSQKSTNDEN